MIMQPGNNAKQVTSAVKTLLEPPPQPPYGSIEELREMEDANGVRCL